MTNKISNGVNVYLATKNDALQIAKIHQQEIDQGFLSQLGIKFLSKLYKVMVISPNSFVVVAKENDRIVGFISGCTNVNKFYRDFLKKYFFHAFFILLPKIFKLSILKKILETLKYLRQKEEKKLPETELLTIAILKKFQGQDIIQKIFEKFISELKKRKIKQFKVVVGENLSRAIGFYEKMGFKFFSLKSIHKKQPSRIYIYNLRPLKK